MPPAKFRVGWRYRPPLFLKQGACIPGKDPVMKKFGKESQR
jgi:hypothetical protein